MKIKKRFSLVEEKKKRRNINFNAGDAGGAIINIFTLIEKPVYRLIKKSNNNNNNHTRAYAGDYISRVCKCRCQIKLIVTIKKPQNYRKKIAINNCRRR